MSRLRALLLIALFLPTASWADSWCSFDQGFLGTAATGYVFPSGLEGNVAIADSAERTPLIKECRIQTYAAPGGTATSMADCVDLHYTPSEYIDAQSPLGSEYFTLMVFDTKDAFVQLRAKDNAPVWAKTKTGWPVEAIGRGGVFPADQIFSKPDRAFALAPLKAMENDNTIQAKIRAMFAGTDYATSKNDAIARLRIPPAEQGFYADFVYEPQQEITSVDGTRWLKAQERLQWDWMWDDHENKPPQPDKKFGVDQLSDENNQFQTEPLRTVYIPVRSPDGTLLNVASYGNLYCD